MARSNSQAGRPRARATAGELSRGDVRAALDGGDGAHGDAGPISQSFLAQTSENPQSFGCVTQPFGDSDCHARDCIQNFERPHAENILYYRDIEYRFPFLLPRKELRRLLRTWR